MAKGTGAPEVPKGPNPKKTSGKLTVPSVKGF